MAIHPELHNNQQFITELQDCAKQLSDKLAGDDIQGASELIGRLIEVRDKNIFNAVGKLTRALHNAIVNFNVDGDLNSDPPEIENSEIKDASDRLHYVIEMTQAAANKTMDMVDASTPLANKLSERAVQFRQQWERLKSREMTADEFREVYNQTFQFFGDIEEDISQLNKNLQDIVLEQGFQDLTGQVLKRVIGLICEVEENLVSLVRIAGQVEEITGLVGGADNVVEEKRENKSIEAEGPQIHAAKRDDVVSGQDDVDDLLSSLGF